MFDKAGFTAYVYFGLAWLFAGIGVVAILAIKDLLQLGRGE